MATNDFCGPLELLDGDGHKVPLLKPGVNSLGAYPSSFKLLEMREILMSRHQRGRYDGPLLPWPCVSANTQFKMFHIAEYFKLSKLGEYKLTVWPKIYKLTSTNDDLCERIDVPSVIIPIEWSGHLQN